MTDLSTSHERRSLYAAGLATMGVCPTWDAAMARYLRCDALVFADAEYGAEAKASEAWQRRRLEMEADHGKHWRDKPHLAATAKRISDAYQAAQDEWVERYCKPLWAALNALAETPAPSLAAALFKVVMIERDEVWNDAGFKADAMQIVTADFDRLGV